MLEVRQQTISEWETGVYQPRGMSERLLGIVAAGLVAYGLLQLANAIFRRIC